MRVCEAQDTGRTLAVGRLPLGVACKSCGRRVLLSVKQIRAHEDDRRALLRLPLLCRCGSCTVQLYLMETPDDAPAFLAGATITPEVSLGACNRWRPSF